MLEATKVNSDSNHKRLRAINDLYTLSFPERERGHMKHLLRDRTGDSEVLYFSDNNVFVGFAALLISDSIAHVLYFAISPRLRGKGYGTEALKAIESVEGDRSVLVDIEAEIPDVPNAEQRHRRKDFYLRNGFLNTGIAYDWRGEQYLILSYGKSCITRNEFDSFWDYFAEHRLMYREYQSR